ncbi:Proline-rich protein LAS17 [Ceratocystis platani]|uniref:Proline-rich protein LAS17 n=1 Tax=Ceratocystis fimbriata f. sp. platani TaxID=88771 RepID=A0A0F8B4C6_CERFI|nr:Proline-rich protein LAS17 [Ceratocystis platani]
MPTILNDDDKETVRRYVPKQSNKIQAVAVAKLYVAHPSRSHWTDTGIQGAVVLSNDLVGNTFWLKIVDISPSNRGVIWDQEIYESWQYNQDRTFFHTFEMEECVAGLSFVDEKEAKQFLKKMNDREKNASKATKATPFGGSGQPVNHKHGILGGLFGGHRHSSAPTVGAPRHQASSSNGNYSEFALLDAFDPQWRENFGEDLKQMGLTEDLIKEDQEFIRTCTATRTPTTPISICPSLYYQYSELDQRSLQPLRLLDEMELHRLLRLVGPQPVTSSTTSTASTASSAILTSSKQSSFANQQRPACSASSTSSSPSSPSASCAIQQCSPCTSYAPTPSVKQRSSRSSRSSCSARSARSPCPPFATKQCAPTTRTPSASFKCSPFIAIRHGATCPSSSTAVQCTSFTFRECSTSTSAASTTPDARTLRCWRSSSTTAPSRPTTPGHYKPGLGICFWATPWKVDRSQIRDRSGVSVAGNNESSSSPPAAGGGAPGAAPSMADALAAALQKRKGKVSKSDDESDNDDW